MEYIEIKYYKRKIDFNKNLSGGYVDYNNGYNATGFFIQLNGKVSFDKWFEEKTYLKLQAIILKAKKKLIKNLTKNK